MGSKPSASAPACLCLTGPTACGKSALALELAQQLPIEIVSVDSAMVYRGMDIGTAKPTLAERAAVPHHLIDIVDPADAYSAGRFLKDASRAVEGIATRGRIALLVGGTLLYLSALTRGLSALPPADEAIRAQLDEEAGRIGWSALHRQLANIDPAAAGRIAPQDRQRIQRALEVYRLTGQPLTSLQQTAVRQPGLKVATVALIPTDRAALRERIARRFDAMVEAGFVAEVRGLMDRGDLDADSPALRSVGYRQIWACLSGGHDWDTAHSKAITATCQLAKRQLTWLRSTPDVKMLPAFAQDLPDALRSWVELAAK